MSSGKVLLGVLAGVAVGALAGVLFAPDKGSETRKKISRKGEDYADALKEKFDDFISGIREKMETATEEAADMADNIKSRADEARRATKMSATANNTNA